MKLDTLIYNPIREMLAGVIDFIPTFLTAVCVLALGWIAARYITKVIVHLLRQIKFDKVSDSLGLSKVLRTGGVKGKPSTLVGCIAYWVMMVMVLITTVKAFNITLADDFLGRLFAYIPHVIIGTLVLIVGMLLANFVSSLVYITAKNTDMPSPDSLKHIAKLAIMVYVVITFLKEIGFVALFGGTHYTIFISGIVFAIALAFGLAGRDVASKYLDVLKKHK